MSNLCAHVKNEHNAVEAVIEQASFENFDQVDSPCCHCVLIWLFKGNVNECELKPYNLFDCVEY